MIDSSVIQLLILFTVIYSVAALSRWRGRREAEAIAASKIIELERENDELIDQLIALASKRHPSNWRNSI